MAPYGRQFPKIRCCEGDETATGGHVLPERVDEADREVGAAGGREHAGCDDRRVADRVDVDAHGVRCARMLTDGADPEPDRGLEHHDRGDDDEKERQPDHQVELREDRSEERHALEERQVDVRDARDVVRSRSLEAVDVDVEVPRQPEREEVDRGAPEDLVRAESDREERVEQRRRTTRENPDEEAQRSSCPSCRPRGSRRRRPSASFPRGRCSRPPNAPRTCRRSPRR